MLVVSLSTIPPRFKGIGPTLNSLLNQAVRPDQIILWIPRVYRRFPEYDGHLPQVPDGVEIRRTDTDYGPATKVLPAVQAFRNQTCEILFCDDDQIYPKNWTNRFLQTRLLRPDDCIVSWGTHLWQEHVPLPTIPRPLPRALRFWRKTDPAFNLRQLKLKLRKSLTGTPMYGNGRRAYLRSGYVDLIGGSGGVMIRPEFLDDPDAFDIPRNHSIVDDMWLSGIMEKRGVRIWVDARHGLIRSSANTEIEALADLSAPGEIRKTANQNCIAYMRDRFGIWQ
ncbi:glycosyltransferase family A protein [Shimia biformata]|uniref:glycosyltransferase family A protein n=1 Tax=Shimia biformata TaxID=1294299 RepID=UPI0019522216|nr:glycosyltransferase family A protein [Shimia biformata]